MGRRGVEPVWSRSVAWSEVMGIGRWMSRVLYAESFNPASAPLYSIPFHTSGARARPRSKSSGCEGSTSAASGKKMMNDNVTMRCRR